MSTAVATSRAPARWAPWIGQWVQAWIGVVAVLVVLELVVRVGIIPSRYFPPMTTTFGTLFGQLGESSFWTAVLQTLEGWAILIYGTGMQSKVFLAAFASTWPMLIQSIYGVRDLDPVQRETALSFRVSRRDRLLKVSLPAAIPYIATGLRISSATALVLSVTAELVIGAPGLGRSINTARAGGVPDLMYALTIATGLLGWLLNTMLARIEARALHWHPSHRETAR